MSKVNQAEVSKAKAFHYSDVWYLKTIIIPNSGSAFDSG